MKDIIKIAGGAIVGVAIFLMGLGTSLQDSGEQNLGGPLSIPTPYVASSTVFTLTTSSQRVLATSSNRIAAQIAPVHCTVAGAVHLSANNDVPATSNRGPVAVASTTLALNSFPNLPVPTGSVQAIMNEGTCKVVVTEWLR